MRALLLLAAVLLAAVSPAWAQGVDAPRIDIQRFDPIPQTPGFTRVLDPRIPRAGTFATGLHINYARNPFELGSADTGARSRGIVDGLIGFDLTGSLAWHERFQTGLSMPVLQIQTQGDDAVALAQAIGGSGDQIGVGDLTLVQWVGLLVQDDQGVALSLAPRVVFPTGSRRQLIGIGTFGLGGDLSIGRRWEGFRFALSVGYQLNLTSQTVLNLHPDDEARLGLGIAIPTPSGLLLELDAVAATNVSPFLMEEVGAKVFDAAHTPFEIGLTLRPPRVGPLATAVGGGPGVTHGFGTPDFRFWGALVLTNDTDVVDTDSDGYLDPEDGCPEEPEDFDGWEDEDGCPDFDNDGDRLLDPVDDCPDEPEDFDRYQDGDGCPDFDNDRDGFLDVDDDCPDAPESKNGVEDDDGCPEDDRDGDGYLDPEDGCPDEPEDWDDFQDDDGCPDPDNDRDGKPDVTDDCPDRPEDHDKWEDEDGCPDPDNDEDGLPDLVDMCPDQPEVYNGVEDQDGCPDVGKVIITKTEIQILEKVYFDTNKATIKPVSFDILDAVVAVLQDFPDITAIEIQGHTDSDGAGKYNLDLSQRRAESVRTYLIDHGVEPGRLTALGFGEDVPIDTNDTDDGKANNRRVEFHILEREE